MAQKQSLDSENWWYKKFLELHASCLLLYFNEIDLDRSSLAYYKSVWMIPPQMSSFR